MAGPARTPIGGKERPGSARGLVCIMMHGPQPTRTNKQMPTVRTAGAAIVRYAFCPATNLTGEILPTRLTPAFLRYYHTVHIAGWCLSRS